MVKLILLVILLVGVSTISLISCSDDDKATVQVIKDKISNEIQSTVGKGDIAIKKYEIKIQNVKDALIKIKVTRKTLEQRIQNKKSSISNVDHRKSEIISASVIEMEGVLSQIVDAENQIEKTLKQSVDNFDIIKAKVIALETRKELMETLSTVEQYTNIDSSITGVSNDLDNIIASMEKDILKIEAELEVNKMLKGL